MQGVILESITQTVFLETILQSQCSAATLIICATKQEWQTRYLDELQHSDGDRPRAATAAAAASSPPPAQQNAANVSHPATSSPSPHRSLPATLQPTLQRLCAASRVKVIFCANLPQLHAYLSVLTTRGESSISGTDTPAEPTTTGARPGPGPRLLAVWDLIKLHRPTLAFSAQGLNKTFAALVDAAQNLGARLLVAESEFESDNGEEPSSSPDQNHIGNVQQGADVSSAPHPQSHENRISVWDEPVSMLNVTTKTFGVGESGWVGRTVTIREIAARWCQVVNVE